VIHAGIYYPAGTLKARLCVEGRERLYEYCERRQVTHVRCGKLIVARSDSDRMALEALMVRAAGNGVDDLRWLSPAQVHNREPHVRAQTALLSPSSGIVSAEELVRAFAHDCASRDVALLPGTRVQGAEPADGGVEIVTERERIVARAIVNAAGLYADEVSKLVGGEEFQIYPCRGEYAELTSKWRGRFKGPVYPLPHPSGHGLGVHVTPTAWGSTLLGPTADYQERKDDYEDHRMPLEEFLDPTRELLPDVTLADLQPGGTGIRAKLHPPEESFADFMIRPDTRQPVVIHAAGIDSPGLTASLAIGAMVAAFVDEVLA
jgi:L-2-hydroxyglutarate oxidase LhgO